MSWHQTAGIVPMCSPSLPGAVPALTHLTRLCPGRFPSVREENEGIVSAATDAAKATLGPGATEEQIELEAIGQCNAILQQ